METKSKPGDAVELFVVQYLLDDGKSYSEPEDEVWSTPKKVHASVFEAQGEIEAAKALEKHFDCYEPQPIRIVKFVGEVIEVELPKKENDE